jgi:hypothetical protein
MTKGLIYHNAMQLSIPFWLTALSIHSFPSAEWWKVGLAATLGATLPDLDHFNMYGKVKHKGLWNFVKYCIKADRYRKAFLPLHNYASMLVVAVASVVFSLIDTYIFIFFTSFLVHLIFDYMADIYMIKQHTHWRLRNWLDESNSRLSNSQQVQQGNKQKYYSRKPG